MRERVPLALSHRGGAADRVVRDLALGWGLPVLAALAMLLLGARSAAGQEREGVAAPVAVAARDLPRGVELAAEDVRFADGAPDGAPVGWITRRVIAEGEPLRAPAVAPPDLVSSGDVVQAVWRSGTIELRLVGRALGSAARGERIQVRIDARRRLRGVVEDRGLVRIEAGDESR